MKPGTVIQSDITFTNTDFQWVWWAIYAPSSDLVTATFVPGSFVTNAPMEVLYKDTDWILFGFNRSAITVGDSTRSQLSNGLNQPDLRSK